MLSILVVEDIPKLRDEITAQLGDKLSGYEIRTADSRDEALLRLAEAPPDLIILDLVLPASATDESADWRHGETVLDRARRLRPELAVIVHSTEETLTRTFLKSKSVDDFFAKDSPEAWERGELPQEVDCQIGHLACRSEAAQKLRRQLDRAAHGGGPVLITGPAGAGKRHASGLLHKNGPRRRDELLTIPLGNDAAARCRRGLDDPHVGTVALTGLERLPDLPASAQGELAGLLEEAMDLDVQDPRLVLISERSLADLKPAEVEHPLLRALRLCREVTVPSLTDRLEDVLELLEVFLREAGLAGGRVMSLDPAMPAALHELAALPGQVAELRQRVLRAMERMEGDVLTPAELGVSVRADCRVLICRDGQVEWRDAPEISLAMTLDPSPETLMLRADNSGSRPVVTEAHLNGRRAVIDDERVGHILYELASRPGERVPLGERKASFGLQPHEHVKRYVHKLRQALDDTEVDGRASRYLISHYGEVCEFRADADYRLVTRSEPPAHGCEGRRPSEVDEHEDGERRG